MNDEAKQADTTTIDSAIEICEKHIAYHRRAASHVIIAMIVCLAGLGALLVFIATVEARTRDSEGQRILNNIDRQSEVVRELQQNRLDREEVFWRAVQDALGRGVRFDFDITDDSTLTDYLSTEMGMPQSDVENVVQAIRPELRALNFAVQDADNGIESLEGLETEYRDRQLGFLVPDTVLYALGALAIILISVLVSLYKFHQREISKNEQFGIGFLRIRVAARNIGDDGFKTEVRKALSEGAFDYAADPGFSLGRKQVESPLPGHPPSELTTALFNKILDQIDVQVTKRGGQASS